LASEDIGNANPNALLLANSTFDAVNKIGYPEATIILMQCAIYLASSAKSNTVVETIAAVSKSIQQHGDLPVPLPIRNAPTKMMKEMNYGRDYQYSHLGENNFIEQEYLPEKISGTAFYKPGNNARENELRKFLKERWKEKYKY
jgi:putative ATPase